MLDFLDGLVKYPDALPCPQADTDLVPRERRYISDITDVRNLRMFQQEFQATRNRISFIFTEEEAREFREWYENDIIHGGAWFYADWPTLHKDKQIAHRFVGQPKYEWLLGANPGAMGRSVAGYNPSVSAVTMYKVTATVELHERKVGKFGKIFTSKIYPYFFDDSLQYRGIKSKAYPNVAWNDNLGYRGVRVQSGAISGYIYSEYTFEDKASYRGVRVQSGSYVSWIYSTYELEDSAAYRGIRITEGDFPRRLITYDYIDQAQHSLSYRGIRIISGEAK